MEYFGFIYEWTDSTNGKTYTGSHEGSIEDKYEGSGILFQRAFKKRPDKFNREILELVYDNRKALLEIEQKYLDKIDWDNTYNLSAIAGGGNTISKFTEEQLKEFGTKISVANKGRKSKRKGKTWREIFGLEKTNQLREDRKGKSSGMLGKKHSEETKLQQSEIKKGKRFSEEHKQKISEKLKGIKRSREFKQNISEKLKGRKHGPKSEEIKRKISKKLKGKPWSEARRVAYERRK